MPPLEEVEARVRDDVIRRKAFVTAQERANEIATTLQDADDFTAAAEGEELIVNSSDLIARGAAVPGVGLNADVEAMAFSMNVGETSDPVLTGNSAVILHVHERQEADDEDFETTRESLHQELVAERQSQFFSAYMENAKARITISIDLAALAQATT